MNLDYEGGMILGVFCMPVVGMYGSLVVYEQPILSPRPLCSITQRGTRIMT